MDRLKISFMLMTIGLLCALVLGCPKQPPQTAKPAGVTEPPAIPEALGPRPPPPLSDESLPLPKAETLDIENTDTACQDCVIVSLAHDRPTGETCDRASCRNGDHWKFMLYRKFVTKEDLDEFLKIQADERRDKISQKSEVTFQLRADACAPCRGIMEFLTSCVNAGIYKLEFALDGKKWLHYALPRDKGLRALNPFEPVTVEMRVDTENSKGATTMQLGDKTFSDCSELAKAAKAVFDAAREASGGREIPVCVSVDDSVPWQSLVDLIVELGRQGIERFELPGNDLSLTKYEAIFGKPEDDPKAPK